jgi:hypothetical protein
MIWLVGYAGLQWRVVGLLADIAFETLCARFARWTRLGVWRALGQRLAPAWRAVEGDDKTSSALVYDSRSLRSSPTAWTRGIDGGKPVKGVKFHAVVDKNGSLMGCRGDGGQCRRSHHRASDAAASRRGLRLQGRAPRRHELSRRALRHGGRGARHDGVRHRRQPGRRLHAGRHPSEGRADLRLDEPLPPAQLVSDRKPEHFLAHAWIAFGSIVSRRIARLQPSERLLCAA